jgi:hypothetical protein
MNSRHLLYVTYTLCFLHELKDKDPKSYEELENSNLNIPIPIFCKILDGIFYYKSYPYVFRTLYKWQIDSEEKKMREKANTLANWSKEWSRRFNKE